MTTSVPDIDDADLLDLTQQLVRLRTVNTGAGVVEQPAADLVAQLMTSYGWQVTISEVAPGRPNVVGVVHGRGPGRTLMFEGHTDVVTEGDPDGWSFDPYSGDVVDGKLLGRGSADMKAGVAAMIHAARAVELGGFDGRIVVAALADEEGMMLGAKHFADAYRAAGGLDGAPIDAVIVCEPEGGELCTVAKGAVRARIDVHGVMAHGAMPHHGRNPLPAIGEILVGIGALEQELQENPGPHPHLGLTSITPTVLDAGQPAQVNVIPAVASVYLDIRTIPGIDHAELIDVLTALAETVAAARDLTATLEVIDDRPVVDTAEDDPVVLALRRAHEEVTGAPPPFGGVPGTTDGTILTRDAGLVTVVYGPGGKWIAHQVDEFVEVDDLVACARVYAATARHFLAAS
ncbi:M20 family metallopeptidase [Nakamurella alba]|nr:M20 family metallopeptidase [Nakamurella alba]